MTCWPLPFLDTNNSKKGVVMTAQQLTALFNKWEINDQDGMTLGEFIDSSESMVADDAIVVKWSGMYLAIETDGHTHS